MLACLMSVSCAWEDGGISTRSRAESSGLWSVTSICSPASDSFRVCSSSIPAKELEADLFLVLILNTYKKTWYASCHSQYRTYTLHTMSILSLSTNQRISLTESEILSDILSPDPNSKLLPTNYGVMRPPENLVRDTKVNL